MLGLITQEGTPLIAEKVIYFPQKTRDLPPSGSLVLLLHEGLETHEMAAVRLRRV